MTDHLRDMAASHDPYARQDPYANKKDPYANKQDPYARDTIEKEPKKHWELDFEIVRFFRENFNSAIDSETSHREFFDDEYMFNLRLRLFKRNTFVIIMKFLLMSLFSVLTLFLHEKLVLYIGAVYIFFFVYLVAVPIGFSKYIRKYILDDSDTGKLKKIYTTYTNWLKPLETITVNFYTMFFILIEMIMFTYVELLHKVIIYYTGKIHFQKLQAYISSLTVEHYQHVILLTIIIYILAFALYKIIVYALLAPKWEKERLKNVKLYKRGFQRTAQNLQDAFTKKDV